MPDLEIMFKSFIITWLRKIDQSEEYNKGWIKALDANLREIDKQAINGKEISLNTIWSYNAEEYGKLSRNMPSLWSPAVKLENS